MGILKDIETFLLPAELLVDEGVPSISIAYLDNPSGSLQSNTITKGRENTETVYQACSISKAITALAVAKLVDQGRLSYETKVLEHIPQSIIQSIGSEHLMENVTVGRLLSHTAGLSQHGFPGYTDDTLPAYEDIFAGRWPANTPRVRFSSFPGSEWKYSGGGYLLLQVFLEKFTGLGFADFMQETLLEPLGMTRSVYGNISYKENNYAQAHFTAYTPGTPGRGYHKFTELAAAGLWTTPTDLLKATSAIQNSLYPNPQASSPSPPFLSQQTAQAMLTPTHPTSPEPSRQTAQGWFTDSTFFAHAGDNDPGYNCYLLASHSPIQPKNPNLPPTLLNLAIMTNSTLGHPIIKKYIAALLAMRQLPYYPSLPGCPDLSSIVPLLAPEGVQLPGWQPWIGEWEEGWEIYEDEGLPMIAWDGIEMPCRLRLTASPMPFVEGVQGFYFKIEGVDMAVRCVPGVGGRKWIEIVGSSVRVLQRGESWAM